MARIKSEEALDTDRHIGMCLGAGMSIEKAAEHIGIHANTVRNHIDGNKQFIFKVKAQIEAILAVQTAKTVTAVKAKAEDRMKDIFDRALTMTERAIQKAEDKEDPTLAELMDIHKNITVWSSKFQVSEAPKRLQIDSEVKHTHELPNETWERLEALERKLVPALPKALPVIDV